MGTDGEGRRALPFPGFSRKAWGMGPGVLVRRVAVMAFLLAVAVVLALNLPDESLHNSDVLYGPAFVGDLFAGTPIGLWSLTPAPYFFPDLTLYAAASGATLLFFSGPGSIDVALRLTAALLFLLDAMAFAFLLRRTAGKTFATGLLSYGAFALMALQVGLFREGFLSAVIPTNHSGLISGILLFWGLWSDTAPRRAESPK